MGDPCPDLPTEVVGACLWWWSRQEGVRGDEVR